MAIMTLPVRHWESAYRFNILHQHVRESCYELLAKRTGFKQARKGAGDGAKAAALCFS